MARLMPLLSEEAESSNAEIIIIDNGSRDGTTNYLSNFNCTVVVNKANRGFSIGNNQGSRIAQGEYLLFLNNDTVITKGFINEMRKTFDIKEEGKYEIGAVGALLMELNSSQKKVQHIGVCFTKDYVAYELGSEKADITPQIPFNDPRVHTIREVPAVTGACLMIKKDLFQSIGGFDEEYINGWEDVDLCLKVRENRFRIMYNGNATVAHMKFGSKAVGRFNHEQENRNRYDSIWVHTGRAKKILGEFRES
jgi:GT2 family glycosyltransferase